MVLAESIDSDKYDISFATGDQYQRFIQDLKFKIHTLSTLSSKIFLERLAKGKPIFQKKK